MKKAILKSDVMTSFPKDFITRYEALTAEKGMLENTLKINKEVENANIHELFSFYDQAFFNG